MPPRLSTGSVVSWTCDGISLIAAKQGDHGERQRDEEDRAPVVALEQGAGDHRAERRDRASDRRPERDRLRPVGPGPEGGDQGEGRREGHAGRQAAEQAGDEQDLDRRREAREQRGGDRQPHAEDDHQLAAVAIAEGAEVEDGRREAERIADGDEVELRLAGVEVLADVGQGDVGDREVQVGDRGDEDQRAEHRLRVRRLAALHRRSFPCLKFPVTRAISICSLSSSAPSTAARKRRARFPVRTPASVPFQVIITLPVLRLPVGEGAIVERHPGSRRQPIPGGLISST